MADSDFRSVLIDAVRPNKEGLAEALELRGAYCIAEDEDPQDLSTGLIQVLIYFGVIFWYDPDDALTAHDGTSCIVDADGKRFKSDGTAGHNSRNKPVLDKDLTAPPGSPAEGDLYIVAAGGTGAWSGKDKNFAEYTARGWRFTVPMAFDIAMVIDESLYYHYTLGGAWTSGLPALTIADGSISMTKLKYFPLGVSVENQTTNAPPGAPADGVAYIVGGAPSGAWTGHTLDVAIYEAASTSWKFFDGYEGARVYDKTLNALYTHDGATWTSPVADPEVYLGRLTFAADATKALEGLSAYKSIRIKGQNIKPSSDNVKFRVRLSSSAGVFLTTGYAGNIYAGGTTGQTTPSSSFEIDDPGATSDIGSAAGDGGLDFTADILSFGEAQKTKYLAEFVFGDAATGAVVPGVTQQWHTAQTAMQGVQFSFTAGNLASGYVDIWGTP